MLLRRLAFPAIALILLAAPGAQAETQQYVTDMLQVTVRSGPSVENKVLNIIKSGDAITVFEENQSGWVRVRTPNGTEGWMLERYLQQEPTSALKLANIDPNKENMLEKYEESQKANRELKAQLVEAQRITGELEAELAKIKEQSANVIELRKEHETLKAEYDKQTTKLDEVSTEADSLRFSGNLKWFLAGAGVLIVGWLIGISMGRRKKRWSSGIY